VEGFKNLNLDAAKKYLVVSQTTFNSKIFDEITDYIEKKNMTNVAAENTICDATRSTSI
jgi:4-hydroxy-3-methylbut-2-enyl diphosphate reductase IspH